MASFTSDVVAITSFTGLKAIGASTSKFNATTKVSTLPTPKLVVKASLKDIGIVVVVATPATVVLTNNALVVEVLLGGNDGSLAFVPKNIFVATGEKIVFKNNVGFLYNVVFDEDEVLAAVDVSKISMSEKDLQNAGGEMYAKTLTEKRTYSFYWAPYQDVGMVGKITVN